VVDFNHRRGFMSLRRTLLLSALISLAPTDGGGWLIEVEVVEARRIPTTSDILALYEVLLDADGELLSYRRIRRYPRGRTTEGG